MDEMRLIDGARLERGIKMLNFYSEKDKQFIIELVRSYPTVEAEPVRHGRWIDIGNNAGMRCSECRYKIRYKNGIKTSASGKIPGGYYDYCPNCGARMDGDKNAAD